jgi:AcrR family transcriptional regulator
VAPGVVHYHFESVQALLVEAAVGAARSLGAQMSRMMADAGSADEAVATLLGMLDAYTGVNPMSLLFVEAYLAATRDPGLRQALGEVIGEVRGELAGCLAAHRWPIPTRRRRAGRRDRRGAAALCAAARRERRRDGRRGAQA